jgi:hypothetical protein
MFQQLGVAITIQNIKKYRKLWRAPMEKVQGNKTIEDSYNIWGRTRVE